MTQHHPQGRATHNARLLTADVARLGQSCAPLIWPWAVHVQIAPVTPEHPVECR